MLVWQGSVSLLSVKYSRSEFIFTFICCRGWGLWQYSPLAKPSGQFYFCLFFLPVAGVQLISTLLVSCSPIPWLWKWDMEQPGQHPGICQPCGLGQNYLQNKRVRFTNLQAVFNPQFFMGREVAGSGERGQPFFSWGRPFLHRPSPQGWRL